MDTRSMIGTAYAGNMPGKYYDQNDNARRQAVGSLSDLISKNPAFRTKMGRRAESGVGYLSGGVPYDVEGLLSSFALKYGQDKALELLGALPTMGPQDLLAVSKLVEGAANESGDMAKRERMAYERAGMEYRGGKYVPEDTGQYP